MNVEHIIPVESVNILFGTAKIICSAVQNVHLLTEDVLESGIWL